MKTDIEIARETVLAPIEEIAQSVGIPTECLEHYGKYMAKVPETLIDEEKVKKSKLILVTAMTPTKSGNGKTTVSIGLALGLNRLGKKAILALREPSLGPCFGMKGGAAGGGYAQVLPMEKINLHFTGDFHAITSAHNMITALLDNYIYQHQEDRFHLKHVLWKRVLDINDRNLRFITTGLGGSKDGVTMQSGFDITPASEIMAILCLSTSLDDLRHRIENILLGIQDDDTPFTVKDMGVAGAITTLLADAIHPNLVQTTEHTPAFVHGGPFANIAHGCNSVLATKLAMTYGEYAITEAGFGADLGAEKFFDIKCRKAGLVPSATVLIVTSAALAIHGWENVERHLRNLRAFGQQVVVCLNKFPQDTEEVIADIEQHVRQLGAPFCVNRSFAEGGEGAEEFAQTVIDAVEKNENPSLFYTYNDTESIGRKIENICHRIYDAKEVMYSEEALETIEWINKMNLSNLPVCIAKTQYSFSTDAKVTGAPKDHIVNIRNIVINRGAGMIVAIAGTILRMPGLPKSPQAERIDIVNGQIEGLS